MARAWSRDESLRRKSIFLGGLVIGAKRPDRAVGYFRLLDPAQRRNRQSSAEQETRRFHCPGEKVFQSRIRMEDERSPLLYGSINRERSHQEGHREEEENREVGTRKYDDVSLRQSIQGYALVIVAGFAFTAANVLQKIVVPELSYWLLLVWRAIVQTSVMFAACGVKHYCVFEPYHQIKRMMAQGLCGGILLMCIFIAVKHVPLGNASAIFFCTPVATFLIAVFMLNENCRLYRSMIIVLMVFGVVLITRPPTLFGPDPQPEHHHHGNHSAANATNAGTDEVGSNKYALLGYLCAIAVPVLSAVVSILTRQLRRVAAPVLMFWFAIGALIVGYIGYIFQETNRDIFDMSLKEYGCTAAIIVLGIFGNVSYTFAVRWVSPSRANVFRSFEVFLNYGLQIFLEGALFHWTSVPGMLCLTVAVLLTAYEGRNMKKYQGKIPWL